MTGDDEAQRGEWVARALIAQGRTLDAAVACANAAEAAKEQAYRDAMTARDRADSAEARIAEALAVLGDSQDNRIRAAKLRAAVRAALTKETPDE